MRGVLVIGLCATGCFSDHGVAIEVDVGDTGATSVELYIGKDACDTKANTAGIDCTTIAPPPAGGVPLRGQIWFRDDLAPYTADVKGHKATLQLKADTATTLPIVIAVGFVPGDQGQRAVGTATLLALEIPTGSARVVTTTLVGANAVVPSTTETTNLTEDRVMVWHKQAPASSCVVVEHWTRGEPVKRAFVVPAEDPDCDDVSHECNAAAYHGSSAAGDSSSRADCVVSAASRCVLGSRGCTDDAGPKQGVCAAQPFQVCVPGAFCSACTTLDAACLQTLVDNNISIPHLECEVPTSTATPGSAICAGQDTGMIDLTTQYLGSQCGRQPTIATVQLAGFMTIGDFGGAIMELSTANTPCSFQIKWKTGTRTTAEVNDRGVIRLDASNSALLLPIVFHFHAPVATDMCAQTPFTCSVKGNVTDPLWSCTKP
jgi:hypothetical protein